MRTILSQTPQTTPQVTYDTSRVSTLIVPQRTKTAEKTRMTDLVVHRQQKNPTNDLKTCRGLTTAFLVSGMGPINCATNPDTENASI